MAQMTNGVTTETTQGWGAQVLANGPRFMGAAGLVLIGAFIAVRVFIGEFVTDSKVALALTAISCVVGASVVALAPLFIWIIRETAKASMAGITPQISETNQLVKSSIEQNAAVMSALITLTSQTMNQRGAPLQLTGEARTPKRFELGQFQDADGDGKDDDDLVEVWVRNSNNQYKKIEYPFSLLDDFMRMPNPSRDLWTHENARYGETAMVIESIDGSPLMRQGNGWGWRVPHAQVMQWWLSAQGRK
jgi:hypothetical protein